MFTYSIVDDRDEQSRDLMFKVVRTGRDGRTREKTGFFTPEEAQQWLDDTKRDRLRFVTGDLLQSDCDIIIHQANCFTRMRSGIAKSIVAKYPQAEKADNEFPIPSGDKGRLGNFSYAHIPTEGVTIVNLYGQYTYGTDKVQTLYGKFEEALRKVMEGLATSPKHIEAYEADRSVFYKIGLPYRIGCGLAGGDWNVVRTIIENVCHDYDVPIYIYKLGA